MLERLKKNIAAVLNWRRAEEYRRGYDWAAGALLRGEMTIGDLRKAIAQEFSVNFSCGVWDAISAYRLLKRVP